MEVVYLAGAFADLRPREVTSARVRPWLEGLLLRRIKYPYEHPRNGQRLDIEFSDGRVRASAEATSMAPLPPKPRRRRGGSGGEGQGNLFGA